MINPYQKENLINWITEYTESDRARPFSKDMRSGGAFLLQEFIVSAVEQAGDLLDLNEKILGAEITALANRYDLNDTLLQEFPAYAAVFFEELESLGRFAEGEALSLFLKTFSGRLGHQTAKRPGAKIGRNDPCPCGSGLKYKKCCQKK